MRKFFLGICFMSFISFAWAQDKTVEEIKKESSQVITKDPNDTIPKIWKTGGLFSLTFNQAALSNWSAGGDASAISLSSSLLAYAFYKQNRHSWDNTLSLAYGFTYTTSLGTRKTDDRIDFLSKYGYQLGKNWYAGLLLNFRTQFGPGYSYPSNSSKILTSDLFAPAYVLVSPGFNYKPNDNFSVFLSPITARWIIVNNDSLASVGAFGVDSGKNVKAEFGAFVSISYIKKFSDQVAYTGRLDLFSNYLHDPQNIDVYLTNLLAVKVAKLLAMTLTFNLIYDNDVKSVNSDGTSGGPKPQIQEIFGIGLAYKF
ncbi:MAG: DUF3078 domain-containing protein [Chitinophagales bacterium]